MNFTGKGLLSVILLAASSRLSGVVKYFSPLTNHPHALSFKSVNKTECCEHFWSHWPRVDQELSRLRENKLFGTIKSIQDWEAHQLHTLGSVERDENSPPRIGQAYTEIAISLHSDPSILGGTAGEITSIDKKVGYIFFPGSTNRNKLVVICGGLGFSKAFCMPYVIMLKELGFSTAIIDYRGHHGDHDENSPNNRLFASMVRYRKKGPDAYFAIDSSRATFGKLDSVDVVNLVKTLRSQYGPFENVFGLGACFGAAVLSWAQFREKIFDAFLFISPFGDARAGAANIIQNRMSFESFFKGAESFNANKKSKYDKWSFKFMRLFLKGRRNPLWNLFVYLASAKIFMLDQAPCYLPFYKNIDVPVCFLSSMYDHAGDQSAPIGDSVITHKLFCMVLDVIKVKNAIVFWSQGVGHLSNWFLETEDVLRIMKAFFGDPNVLLARYKPSLEIADKGASDREPEPLAVTAY